ncbi:MAG TPA: malto-oligosyltrehalose synthase, partial [Flavipsychrobacter sp.]|nr:malto-oligosyltrehalose synthase [Flavipsychrobacter sp.]
INPHRVNPEIGTEEQLRNISARLNDSGINWLQDIVPNHMAFHPDNGWLMDVLEKGKESEYASYFDINWESKLMVPFLGNPLDEVIRNNELKVLVEHDKTVLKYYDSCYPVNDASVNFIHNLHDDWFTALQILNGNRELLLQLANMQHYRLCHWQETDVQINFRRFFTINGLICLNIQHKKVFEHYHQFIKQLVEEGVFTGLRIDHIDGLYEPTAYLENLKELVGFDKYVVVEKILQPDENLPEYWSCEGTTGYEFLAIVNNLFTNKKAEEKFTTFYQQLTGNQKAVAVQIREKKDYIMHHHMGGELENLYQLFVDSNLAAAHVVSKEDLKAVIAAFLVECPVYRYYGSNLPLDKKESNAVKNVLDKIRLEHPHLSEAVALLDAAFLKNPESADEDYKQKAAHFYKRCMQFSGPLTAKGVEDTLMYTYNRFIAHNDVGDAPEAFGFSVEEVHQKMLARQKRWNLSINTTSTHDTKRGEDVRARLNVLTDLDDEWLQLVNEWRNMNASLKQNNAPDANDEYFIYQTLIGAMPMDGEPDEDFSNRIDEYLQKALREAKLHSNWTTPNEDYETATKNFARKLLDKDTPFWKGFSAFHKDIVDAGIVNSLSQLLLKFTCPGVPDIYQGTEMWDLSLVDPDNRRAVDYEKRQGILHSFNDENENPLEQLWQKRNDGNIKLWMTQKLLQERNTHKELFAEGHYLPLKVEGRFAEHVFAFARRYKDVWYVVAVPLHVAQLCGQQNKSVTEIDWRNTRIILRPNMPVEYEGVIKEGKGKREKGIFVNDIFKTIPLAFLKMQQPKNERAAGILLSISSLPSSFGVGDLGPQAINFAKFLSNSKQKYWQILPLNPTEKGSGHSPYSSYSSMAGNPLLISPELLVADGLLDEDILEGYKIESTNKADYDQAEAIKNQLFDIAYRNFCNDSRKSLQREFEQFCKEESYWLDDMSLYKVLKDHHQNKSWYEWERPFKMREAQPLDDFKNIHGNEVRKIKWLQFIFSKQWKTLRKYANSLAISLFGDMPFYVSYDSVDVWANPEIFCLDDEGNMTGVAGVPPDYFSETGQLWGMPTFNWSKLKEQNYEWWVQRLKKNLELFDLLRIDHFRALQDYWQVPAGETTAINGEWIPGPRKEFFDVMRERIGKLPFVAEDLGDKMEAVYELRDQVALPGMKVLQFAWGENMPASVDIPHNHPINSIVYTGTHDNNTTIGWYKEEANKADHERMHHYLGLKVKQKNIHEILARVAYASVGKTVILPMQDILGLDGSSRMNTPGKAEGNWLWRMTQHQLNEQIEIRLRDWVETYNRY